MIVVSEINKLIHDWHQGKPKSKQLTLLDESLRDGVQSTSVRLPDIAQQEQLIESMDAIGIEYLDIGFPGSSSQAYNNVLHLVNFIEKNRLNIKPSCAGRTHIDDTKAIVNISQTLGCEIEPLLFIGVSPVRQLVENWDLDFILNSASDALQFSLNNNVKPTLVIEDATRATPNVLIKLYDLAMELGVERLTICDTVGQCVPSSVRSLLGWSFSYFNNNGVDINLDWHGHNDRGLALINSLEAIESGCDRIHGTALGIGERTGNTAIDQVLANLHLDGHSKWNVSELNRYIALSSKYFDFSIPPNYPVFGDDVFKTASGVHASAIKKAKQLQNETLTDLVYSAVPAKTFNRKNKIEINHMSGRANVHYWLEQNSLEIKDEVVEKILRRANEVRRTLTHSETLELINEPKPMEKTA
jgi:2-isopropylmalate synthase